MASAGSAKRIARLASLLGIRAVGSGVVQPHFVGEAGEAFKGSGKPLGQFTRELAKEMGVEKVPIFTSKDPLAGSYYADVRDPKRKFEHGLIAVGEQPPEEILAHEMGHAKLNLARSPEERKTALGRQNTLSKYSILGALAAAVAAKSGARGLGKLTKGKLGTLGRIISHKATPHVAAAASGLGTGYAMNYPLLAEESGATEEAIKALEKLRGKKMADEAREKLKKAYRTYQVSAALSTLAGTVPGAI
jgi:hypothetical protein